MLYMWQGKLLLMFANIKRRFDNDSVSKSYQKISEYIKVVGNAKKTDA